MTFEIQIHNLDFPYFLNHPIVEQLFGIEGFFQGKVTRLIIIFIICF
jgi:hypothetical protein